MPTKERWSRMSDEEKQVIPKIINLKKGNKEMVKYLT